VGIGSSLGDSSKVQRSLRRLIRFGFRLGIGSVERPHRGTTAIRASLAAFVTVAA
jgi:hypothetical protein